MEELVEAARALFQEEELRRDYAARGSFALQHLHRATPLRAVNELDLSQRRPVPVGGALDVARRVLEPTLGPARVRSRPESVRLVFPEAEPGRLALHLHTRDHLCVLGPVERELAGRGGGPVGIPTFAVEELVAHKLLLLHRRREPDDVVDLDAALGAGAVDPERVRRALAAWAEHVGVDLEREALQARVREVAEWAPSGAAGEETLALLRRLPRRVP